MWVYIWLGVFVATMLIEFLTFELVSVWISVGAIVAMILAFCGASSEAQIITAVAVSIFCLLSLRKVTLKFLNRNKEKTNIDAAVGKIVKMETDCTEDKPGSAKYNGVVWTVVSSTKAEFKAGEHVEIVKIEGNKLIVKQFKKEEE